MPYVKASFILSNFCFCCLYDYTHDFNLIIWFGVKLIKFTILLRLWCAFINWICPSCAKYSPGGVYMSGGQSNWTSPTAVCVLSDINSLSDMLCTFLIGFGSSTISVTSKDDDSLKR